MKLSMQERNKFNNLDRGDREMKEIYASMEFLVVEHITKLDSVIATLISEMRTCGASNDTAVSFLQYQLLEVIAYVAFQREAQEKRKSI